MKKVNNIMCCCGCGLGSSMIVSMNVETALNELGYNDIEVDHTSISDATPDSADLFIIAKDLEEQVSDFENKIILDDIMNMDELKSKLDEYLKAANN